MIEITGAKKNETVRKTERYQKIKEETKEVVNRV